MGVAFLAGAGAPGFGTTGGTTTPLSTSRSVGLPGPGVGEEACRGVDERALSGLGSWWDRRVGS
jgi:hypothetical protein